MQPCNLTPQKSQIICITKEVLPIVSIFTKTKDLEEENSALKKDLEKVEIYNVRLVSHNKSLIQEQEKNVQKIAEQQEEMNQLSAEVEERKSQLLSLNSSYQHLEEKYENLLEKLEMTPEKKHNERGAGRKQTISIFHIRHINTLLNQGKSVREISEHVIPQLGSSWKSEKVRYVMRRYLQQNGDGLWIVLPSDKS